MPSKKGKRNYSEMRNPDKTRIKAIAQIVRILPLFVYQFILTKHNLNHHFIEIRKENNRGTVLRIE